MTHESSCHCIESAIHLTSSFKAEQRHETPILQHSYSCISAHLGAAAFSSIFFLTPMGIRGSVLGTKGICCSSVKSECVLHHTSSWASSSSPPPNQHKQPVRRWETRDAAKENLHRPGQTSMWLPTYFQDPRSNKNLQNVSFLRLCPRSSSARPSGGTAPRQHDFQDNPIPRCDKLLQNALLLTMQPS